MDFEISARISWIYFASRTQKSFEFFFLIAFKIYIKKKSVILLKKKSFKNK